MIRPHDESMLELASLRAIGALDAQEAAIIDQHMATCALCRTEFERSRAVGTAIAFAAATPAPEHLRARVLHSAVKIRRVRPWYRNPAGLSAIAAAVIVAVAGSWLVSHRTPPQKQWALKCAIASADCGGTVVAAAGLLQLDAHGLPPPPSGKVYQAWIIRGTQAPIPEPTFAVSKQGDGAVAIPTTPGAGDVVAVTLEPKGGSKAPTTKPVLLATLD
jgi:anti-sigma-K factor RskA